MLEALPLRTKLIFILSSILINAAVIWICVWGETSYELRHCSSDDFYQLGADDLR